MKALMLLFATLTAKNEPAVFKSLISCCYEKKDHYFCNHGNKSVSKKKKSYLTFGYCCPNYILGMETAPQCQPNTLKRKGIRCTALKKPPLPIYMSYWPEMKSRYCSLAKRDIVADSQVQTVEVVRSLIKTRRSKYYESCSWTVRAGEGFKPSARL